MIMASSELILSESGWQSLLSFREYVKQLFDVDISRNDGFQTNEDAVYLPVPPTQQDLDGKGSTFFTNGNRSINCDGNQPPNESCANTHITYGDFVLRPPPVIAWIETKSSPENLEKFKKFAVAFTPSHPRFRVITLHVENQQYFEMVQACSTSIQQSTAALIKPCPKKLDFTIQGDYSCVEAASSKVNMILHDFKSKPLEECFTPSFEGNNNIPTSDKRLKNHDFWSDQQLSPKTRKTTTSTLDSNFLTNDRVYSDHSYGNAYNLLPLSNALQEEKFANSTTNQHHQKQCENNLYGSPYDSEEENILTDDRFKRHIDQASKCGFSDKQIANVLRRLGTQSSIDDMMRELVQQPQEINDNSKSLSSLQESVDKDNDVATLKFEEEDSEESKEFDANDSRNLRHIVIDGSNVAMSHGHKVFSCKGIKIVVDWFKKRGHESITVFVPQWRKEASRPDAPISNQEILTELEQERIVVFTPARRVGGTRIVCYDDRYVLQLAAERNGIVVSNDVYRDLVRERDDFREVVDKRLLMYSFVSDTFMPPEDPLGRQGPSLDNFLRIKPLQPKHKPQNCPYGKKCTYGNKCRFYHPERRYAPQKMVAEQLKENAEMKLKSAKSSESITEKGRRPKPKLSRTVSLLPQDPFASPVVSGEIEDDFKKPPLQHSKSSSYLTGSRLRMEQAESEEVIQAFKPTSQYNQMTSSKSKVVPEEAKEVKKYLSNSCTVSPRTSPTPSAEPVKNKLKETRSFPSSPVPMLLPSAPMKSSLNIPNPEPQGRYLSGHVLVAKRLSDEENNSGNFFSQHTSRTPGSSQQERNKQTLSPDNNSSITLAPETISHQKQNEDTQVSGRWDSSEIFLPPEIPPQEDRTLASTSPFYFSKDESMSNAESFNSCPVFTPNDEVFKMPQHQNFQRSLSTHTPFRPSEYQPARNGGDRKYSLNTYMDPQSSAPSYYHHVPQSQSNPTIPFQSYQRNKSLDSGISSGLSVDQNSSIVSPTDIQYPPFNNLRNAVLSPPPNIAPAMMQQRDMLYPQGPVSFAPQGVGNPVYPTSGHASVNPWQYSPLPNNRMPFPSHDRSFGEIHNPGSQMNPATSQLPFSSPTYATHYYSPRAQFLPSYPSSFVSTESQYYQMPTQYTASPDNYVPRSQPKVIDEEAPIEPKDPRYAIYFNLSSVFGERYVRTFMNRNPDVTKERDLLNLILSYTQDMGR